MRHYLLILFFTSLWLNGCGKDPEPQQPSMASSETANSPVPSASGLVTPTKLVHIKTASRPFLTVEPVWTQQLMEQVRAPGQVEFRQRSVSKVGVHIAGQVAAINVQVGDKIRVGDVLLMLHSPEAAAHRAALLTTQASLKLAEQTVQRQSQMLKRGVGLELEKLEADRQLAQARAEYDSANRAAQLLGAGVGEAVAVKSTIAGTVLKLNTTLGAAVNLGDDAMVEIGDADALWVVAEVFERDLPLLAVGDRVKVELSAPAAQPIPGKVAALGVEFANEQRRVPVYITLTAPAPNLRPGMYAKVAITPQQQRQLLLPTEAVLIKDGKRTVVYVEVGEGVYEQKTVVVGESEDGKVPVLEGLQDGDRVVVHGALLVDGEADQLL
ncbi:MAG: efflux transporter periplasmic adaptor subunit [Methylobacter sp.]|nr:MAG: efflux transporter periplasmic adaptor subunit [Methylobacter sp.]